MMFVQLDDGTAQHEVAVFSEGAEANKDKIVIDEVLIVERSATTTSRAASGSSPRA